MPLSFSKLPFFVAMSDIRELGIEGILRRNNFDTIDEVVRKVVEDLSDPENDEDLQCGQRIDDVVISDEETQAPTPSCSNTSTENFKHTSFASKDAGFGRTSRALKRTRLVAETSAPPPKTRRTRTQKTLMDQPLVPPNENEFFATRMRSLMMTQTLLLIVKAIAVPLTMGLIETILTDIQSASHGLNNMTPEARLILQTFVQEAIQVLCQNPGLPSLQSCTSINLDPTWSTTRCGIVTMKKVTKWLNNCIIKIVPQQLSLTSLNNPSTLLSTTQSKASDTSIYCTTASGHQDGAAAHASRGIQDQTLTAGLLGLARCRVKTGNRSSHIYVQDQDGSYKYVLEDTCGDHLLDIRVYPTKDIEKEESKNWWRCSSIRGQIVVSSSSSDRPTSPVYRALQTLIHEIHNMFASDDGTLVTRMPLSRKSSE